MGQLFATILLTIVGFIIGGLIGQHFTEAATWFPAAWWGALTGFIVSLGGCLCHLDDIAFD